MQGAERNTLFTAVEQAEESATQEDSPLSWLTETPPQTPRWGHASSLAGFGEPGQWIAPDKLGHWGAAGNSPFSQDPATCVAEGAVVPPPSSARGPGSEARRPGQGRKAGAAAPRLRAAHLPRSSSTSTTASGSSTDHGSGSPRQGFVTAGFAEQVQQGMPLVSASPVVVPGAIFPANAQLALGPVMTMAWGVPDTTTGSVPTLVGALPMSSAANDGFPVHVAAFPAAAFPAAIQPAHMCSPLGTTTPAFATRVLPVPKKTAEVKAAYAKPGEHMHRRVEAFGSHVKSHSHAALTSELTTMNAQNPPPFGVAHRWHRETMSMGKLSQDSRTFTKEGFEGRLSIVSEDRIRTHGMHSYAVSFSEGALSSADGVGFIFSSHLPCPKNIQRIVSIFANRTGRICVRANAKVIRLTVCIGAIELGDWVTVTTDLDTQTAEFKVWPADGRPPSSATLAYGEALRDVGTTMTDGLEVSSGYFACVVKNRGVTVNFGS